MNSYRPFGPPLFFLRSHPDLMVGAITTRRFAPCPSFRIFVTQDRLLSCCSSFDSKLNHKFHATPVRRDHLILLLELAAKIEASESPRRLSKKCSWISRAGNLECADNGGSLDLLAFWWSLNPKRRRPTTTPTRLPRWGHGCSPPHSKFLFPQPARPCSFIVEASHRERNNFVGKPNLSDKIVLRNQRPNRQGGLDQRPLTRIMVSRLSMPGRFESSSC